MSGKHSSNQKSPVPMILGVITAVLVVVVLVLIALVVQAQGSRNAPAPTEPPVITLPPPPTGGETEPPTTLPPDTTPPIIEGVEDKYTFAGDALAYRIGVSVTDDTDPDPVLEVDNSAVDLSTPGEYTVVYIATDAALNQTRVEAKVIVKAKPEGYVDPDEIYVMADNILAEILTPEMTAKEQVQAIYNWTRSHVSYGGHSDRSDYEQTAHTIMTVGVGDCYGYFSVTKLFFERLGLPNIDVQKVRNYSSDSDHFWSLVSIDGGETYYHFDATPRKGQTRDFCLITDAQLDAYSQAHGNCHNRDKTLYPATPEAEP